MGAEARWGQGCKRIEHPLTVFGLGVGWCVVCVAVLGESARQILWTKGLRMILILLADSKHRPQESQLVTSDKQP